MTSLWRSFRLLRRMNWLMLLAAALLLVTGVMFIASACYTREDATRTLYLKQLGWVAAGAVFFVAAAMFDYRRLREGAWWFYALTLALLVAVLLVGTRMYGARRWLMLFGVGIQPSELAKLAVIILLASVFSPGGRREGEPPAIWKAVLLAAPLMILILKQPDLGTTLVFVPVVLGVLFAGGASMARLRLIVLAGMAGALAVIAAIVVPDQIGMRPERREQLYRILHLSKYQRDRIEVFVKPDKDPTGAGWNRRQSQIAVGSGGLWGKGYRQGTQNELGFLPRTVAPTDFIFAVIAEETGFLGSAGLLVLYALLLAGGIQCALAARDRLGRLLCVGVTVLLFSHVFVNVAMTVGLMPITGLPLPLVSYGGTFLISTMMALGLLQSVYIRRVSAWGAWSRGRE